MSDTAAEAPQPAGIPEALQPDPTATAQIHDSIADEAHRLVKALEGIYEDTNLRGEVVTAKNALKSLLARLEGQKQQEQTATPPEGSAA